MAALVWIGMSLVLMIGGIAGEASGYVRAKRGEETKIVRVVDGDAYIRIDAENPQD